MGTVVVLKKGAKHKFEGSTRACVAYLVEDSTVSPTTKEWLKPLVAKDK